MISEEEKQKILEEIIRERDFRTEIRPDEFYMGQLMREQNLTRAQAEILIDELLKSGRIVGRPAKCKGKSCTAYHFISP
jgi:hypothetical protein